MAEYDRKKCKQCEEQGGKVLWKTGQIWRCQECGKSVDKILDLHHTDRVLCSLECERDYWLDILY